MFALPKLIVVVLVVAAAWVGYRWLNGMTRDLPRSRAASQRASVDAEDLVACGVCGAYVAARASACGRPDCPRPG
jgi:DNA-binding helix-hairpin-helix protein with protein kinase domain